MVKLLEIPLKLTKDIAMVLTGLCVFFGIVTWLAAREAILILAPIVSYAFAGCAILAALVATAAFIAERSNWLATRRAELRRDRTLADNEAAQSTIQTDRARMHLTAEARLMAATVRQVERGLIHPAALGDGKFSSFPAQVINRIENGSVPLIEAEAPKFIPDRVELQQLMSRRPSLRRLILGVTDNNQIVTEALNSLTHVAIAGVTRFGKSIFVQQLLYQIATAEEDCKLYLADLGGTTFVDFGLPYASTLPETEALIADVMREAERRKALYEATGRGIRSLDIYNRLTGHNLPWLIMVIDEALYLMEKSKTVKENLEIAVSWAAKYGISCIIISQDWKSNVIATSTRNNFSSRFQFLAEDRTQANILIKGCEAEKIENKGRCFARLPGSNRITELQTPYVSEAQIAAIAPHIQGKARNVIDSTATSAERESIAIANWPGADSEPTGFEKTVLEAYEKLEFVESPSWNKLHHLVIGEEKNYSSNQKSKYMEVFKKFGIDPGL